MAKSPRILVVDHERAIRGILNELFTEMNYDVVEAPSVEVALVKMGLIKFDIILSDIRMAGKSGIELLKKVKKMALDTEVIIMTSHASLESSLEALRLGAFDYLIKPFEELEYVEGVVARALLQIQLKRENLALLENLKQKKQQIKKDDGLAERILVETSGFYKISSSILKSKDVDTLMSHLEEGLAFFLKGESGIIWRYQRDQGVLAVHKTIGLGEVLISPLPLVDEVRVSDAALCLWLKKGNARAGFNKLLKVFAPKHLIHQPMIYQDNVYGLLTVMNRRPQSWAVHEKNAFVHLCLITAMMLHFIERRSSLAPLRSPKASDSVPPSIHDSLRGLVCYDYFLELLDLETMRARRYNHPFTLLLLVLDFSPDQEKDPETRSFLQEWEEFILSRIRTTDIFARYKNKIFILLPETSRRESRKVVRAMKGKMVSLTASKRYSAVYGEGQLELVVYPENGDNVGALILGLEACISGDLPE